MYEDYTLNKIYNRVEYKVSRESRKWVYVRFAQYWLPGTEQNYLIENAVIGEIKDAYRLDNGKNDIIYHDV